MSTNQEHNDHEDNELVEELNQWWLEAQPKPAKKPRDNFKLYDKIAEALASGLGVSIALPPGGISVNGLEGLPHSLDVREVRGEGRNRTLHVVARDRPELLWELKVWQVKEWIRFWDPKAWLWDQVK